MAHPSWRMTIALLAAAAVIVAVSCGAQSATPQPSATTSATRTSGTASPARSAPDVIAAGAARDALAAWLGPVGDRGSITVTSVEPVEWSNSCLEVRRAARSCSEARVPGYRTRLALGRASYEVRTDASGALGVWVPAVQILVRFVDAGPNLVRFRTDDGGTIEAQTVPGTDIAVDLASARQGDPLAVALVDAPQRAGHLLVWIDPMDR